jgi:hypothetical protein
MYTATVSILCNLHAVQYINLQSLTQFDNILGSNIRKRSPDGKISCQCPFLAGCQWGLPECGTSCCPRWGRQRTGPEPSSPGSQC